MQACSAVVMVGAPCLWPREDAAGKKSVRSRNPVSDLRKVPWPLWVLAALTLIPAVQIEVEVHGPIPVKVLYPFIVFGWLFFLLKGVRWVWIATLAVTVLGFAPDLITGSLTWRGAIGGALTIGLLLLPITRRYFASEPAVASATGTSDGIR